VTIVLRRIATVVAVPVALLAVWWVMSAQSTSYYLPPLSKILSTFDDVWFNQRFLDDVVPSLLRLLVGFSLALVLGIALGVLVGSSRAVRSYCEPVLEFLRSIPPPVLVPVLMLFAGIGDTMKVLVIVSGCVWPILLNTVEGVRAVDQVLSETCRVYRIGGRARLTTLVLRSASPQIMAGVRQAVSIGIILMVISEMFAASNGLGFTIIQFQRSFNVTEMWTGILLLGILGFVLSLAVRAVDRRILRWYHGQRRTHLGAR
jgi:ABC-type nitrate/sulfonate/bicarbonate transport system permease component